MWRRGNAQKTEDSSNLSPSEGTSVEATLLSASPSTNTRQRQQEGGGGDETSGGTRVSEQKESATAAEDQRTIGTASSDEDVSSDGYFDGEYSLLVKSLEDDTVIPLTDRVHEIVVEVQQEDHGHDASGRDSGMFKKTLSGTVIDLHAATAEGDGDSVYGNPLSAEEAAERMPPGGDAKGIGWKINILPDQCFVNGKLRKRLNKRDFDLERQSVKPRRGSLPVRACDLFSSLTKIDGPTPGSCRHIFYGILNGWPSLRCFELELIQQRRHSGQLPTAKDLVTGQILWKTVWSACDDGIWGVDPPDPASFDDDVTYRAKLRGAPWTARGWSKDSPGYAFWFEAQHPDGPRLVYGTDMVKQVGDDRCKAVHMFSHRYAVSRETTRDRLTYHSVVLLEWEHGRYCTILEVAYLNGLGGYKGKSNWYHDKDEPVTGLYRILPPEMICPWRSNAAEIRCFDVQARSLEDFKAFVGQYSNGPNRRFVDPHFTFSHAARLTFRSKQHIAQYMLNYIQRDSEYSEMKRNCQTFAADVCGFLAGKKDIEPFHPVNRIDYTNRTYLFLYDSDMYKTKKDKDTSKTKKPSTFLEMVGSATTATTSTTSASGGGAST